MTIQRTLQEVTKIFWSRVDKKGPDECWNWLAGGLSSGYGEINYLSKPVRAHRFSMFLHCGFDLQSKDCVLHKCDNPSCVNPNHLFLGDRGDNMRDCVAKGRHCFPALSGESHPMSVINRETAEVVSLAEGNQREIAKRFGISQSLVQKIKSGEHWSCKK